MAPNNVEERIGRLEDLEALKNLQVTFSYAVDRGDWQAIAELFVEDAIADFGSFGYYRGKSEVIRYFRDIFPPAFSFMAHMLHNPLIKIEGNEATAEWYFETPVTHTKSNRALWIAGKYESECCKVAGTWRYKTLRSNVFYVTPYDEGWVKTRIYESKRV